jgi:hypothetical protein
LCARESLVDCPAHAVRGVFGQYCAVDKEGWRDFTTLLRPRPSPSERLIDRFAQTLGGILGEHRAVDIEGWG